MQISNDKISRASAVFELSVIPTRKVKSMSLQAVEIKCFIPAKDFQLSKSFYADLGFHLASEYEGVAYFHCNSTSFLLQNFYNQTLAENLQMHLLVTDVDAWHHRVSDKDICNNYDVSASSVEVRPWRMRDFTLTDPSGVLWRIAQNIQ